MRGPAFQMIYPLILLSSYNHAGLKILTWDQALVRSFACSTRFCSHSHHHPLICRNLKMNLKWQRQVTVPLLSFLPETEESLLFSAICFLQRGPKTNRVSARFFKLTFCCRWKDLPLLWYINFSAFMSNHLRWQLEGCNMFNRRIECCL